jgi:hypothetical protein
VVVAPVVVVGVELVVVGAVDVVGDEVVGVVGVELVLVGGVLVVGAVVG